ncbi:MAG TPA: NAD-dependent epimerase/dehydratase family protein, partial [Zeimonas sp.]
LARWTVHLAPPPPRGIDDPRIGALIAAARPALHRARRSTPARWVLAGTTGVYGDAGGSRFDETRPIAPATDRARRRAAAEFRLRSLARCGLAQASILRVPGLYAHDRWPLDRLRRGDPVLHRDEDVYTNHLHADDLARIAWRALFRGRPGRIVHATDDAPMQLGDWLDRIALAFGLAKPPRTSRTSIAAGQAAALPQVLGESRRLDNLRLRRELGYRLRWPTVDAALAAMRERRGKAL